MSHILLIDDDLRFRKTLRLALDSHGYKVTEAAGGKEALDLIVPKDPDVIVLDWQMPDMDGIQTCRILRARSKVPIIIVSGNRSNSREAALEAGANDYVPKPFSLNDLLIRIESALNHKGG